MIESNQDGVVDENNDGEGSEEITLKKGEYSKLNETIGSLKRELKDLKKVNETPKNQEEKKSDDVVMKKLYDMSLKMAGITTDDDVEFLEKWKRDNGYENADVESVLGKKGFQTEFADFRTAKQNAISTDVKGGEKGGGSGDKDADYWLSRATKNSEGKLMFPEDLPNDYKLRAAIVDKMIASTESTAQFYNQ